MPQYQGIWTLAQAAQLQSTQQWATDPLFENTTLLLQADNAANGAQNNTFLDSSSNSFTITRNGNTTQGTFTPYSATGWSVNFNNTNYTDIYVASSADFNFGSGDFTIECFLNSSDAMSAASFWRLFDTGQLTCFFFSGNIYLRNAATSELVTVVAHGLSVGVWYHLAIVRSSTTYSIYRNGVLLTSGTGGTITSASAPFVIGTNSTYSQPLSGYVSNFRVTTGQALYTTTFTPATAPLTTTSQGATASNVKLLTCQSNRFVDNSTQNTKTILFGDNGSNLGTRSVQAFSPFAPQYQYTPSVTGGSGYFDGTGDYLQIANNAVLTPSGDFTIEFWAYVTDSSGTQEWYSKGYGIQIYIASAVWGSAFSSSNNSTYYVNYATAPVITNAWTHVAVTRSGNTYRLFINGTETNSATSSSAPNTGTDVLRLGEWSLGTTFGAKGYMSAVRYINGTAVYTSNFTPPTAPLTAITNTSLLLNFTNAGIYDGTLKNNLETVGNAQVSTSVVKYGTGSMYFDGTGDWLQALAVSNELFRFGTNDFTVECWFYRSSTSGRGDLLGTYSATPTGWGLGTTISTTADVVFYIGNTALASTSASAWSVSTWTHVAVVRLNNNLRIYVNGVSQASVTNTTNLVVGSPLQVGAAGNSTQAYNGYIDDLRITKGIARYTANFTPPRVALPRQ